MLWRSTPRDAEQSSGEQCRAVQCSIVQCSAVCTAGCGLRARALPSCRRDSSTRCNPGLTAPTTSATYSLHTEPPWDQGAKRAGVGAGAEEQRSGRAEEQRSRGAWCESALKRRGIGGERMGTQGTWIRIRISFACADPRANRRRPETFLSYRGWEKSTRISASVRADGTVHHLAVRSSRVSPSCSGRD